MNDLVKEMTVKIEQGPDFKEFVIHLMKFPNDIPKLDETSKYLNKFIDTKFIKLLNRHTSESAGYFDELKVLE